MDFVGRRNARQIDIADANGDTPLQLALAANDRVRVRLLIQWGANTRQAAIPVIQSLPLLTDPEWNFYFHAIGTDLAQGEGTNEGTWLHETVRGLDTQLTRNENNRRVSKKKRDSERAKLGTRAENMIRKIRRGNDFSRGDIAVTDAQGRTAWRIANERGLFPRIQRALQ
ncbi:hypothetical protein BJY01DRAFT_14772 [Aspergillus pseudoustus]|uniref:Ankyrin repeat-containing domain protein n=1 Tax=Aspergillus pseudoustus TaxID=1810923 RepID=A0ABR4JMN2_9EURO